MKIYWEIAVINDDKEWGYIDNIHNPTNIPTEWVDLEGTF